MSDDHVFGSSELTPELLRTVTFEEEDGRYDAAEVRTFLERTASALDVLQSQDAATALRAEFGRSAEIAQQVLDAAQTASEQLRRQAGEEARRIIEETREATAGLRDAVEQDLADSRTHVMTVRGQLIQDLRDLYDRIGASLYRFEKAVEEAPEMAAIAPVETVVTLAEPIVADPEPEPEVAPPVEAAAPAAAPEPAAPVVEEALPELPEGAKPPAWQQLPPEAWSSELDVVPPPAPQAAAVPAVDPFLVVEDEPLAPGEPLIDLSELHEPVVDVAPEELAETVGDDLGGAWLDPIEDAPTAAEPEASDDLGGSWLEAEAEGAEAPGADAAAPAADETLAHDNALAEALIAGSPFPDAPGIADAVDDTPRADTPVLSPITLPEGESPDAAAMRELIQSSIADGHSREAVATYLRDHMGLLQPDALIDASLGINQP